MAYDRVHNEALRTFQTLAATEAIVAYRALKRRHFLRAGLATLGGFFFARCAHNTSGLSSSSEIFAALREKG